MNVINITNQSCDMIDAACDHSAPSGYVIQGDNVANAVPSKETDMLTGITSGLGGLTTGIESIVPLVGTLLSGFETVAGLFDNPIALDSTPSSINTTDIARSGKSLGFKKNDYNCDQSEVISQDSFCDMDERLKIFSRIAVGTWSTTDIGKLFFRSCFSYV